MNALSPIAVSGASLLRAIQAGGDLSATALAEASGRKRNNISRDLGALEKAGLVTREPGSPPALTQAALDALAVIDGGQGATAAPAQAAPAIRHDEIIPDPENPRRDFDSEAALEALQELSNSIAHDGLLENLVLRPMPERYAGLFDSAKYMIIAGERRWRAIGLAIEAGKLPEGWAVPHTLRDVDEVTARRLALVENLQRRDLKPLEEARALQQLVDLDGRKTAEIAEDIGFTQRWAQQRLQLLQLSAGMQTRLDQGHLGVKEARTVLAIWDRLPENKRSELEAGHISAESARAWLDQQPVPLSDAAKLALCEFAVKWEREPYKGISWSSEPAVLIVATTVRTEVPDSHTRVKVEVGDPALDELVRRSIFAAPGIDRQEEVETGRHFLQRRYYSDGALKEAFATAMDPKARDEALKVLRVQLHGLQVDADCEETGRYATAWLNADPVIPAEIQAEIDAKRAASAERDRKRKEEREADEAARRAAQQVHIDRLNSLREAEVALAAAEDTPAAAGALAADQGLPLPWWFDENTGEVIAANGFFVESERLYTYQGAEKARRRLMVALANASAGLTAPAQQPTEMDPDAIARDAFETATVAYLVAPDEDEEAPEPMTYTEANEVVPRALNQLLADEGWVYGQAGTYDWDENGAHSLALAILRGEYATDAEQADVA